MEMVLPADLSVTAGDHDRLIEEENEEKYQVERIRMHPLYTQTSGAPYDIALLRMSKTITMNQHEQTICLPTKEVPPNSLCAAT